MKTKNFFTLSILIFILLTGCGREDRYDIPAGFTNGHQKADFEAMNSFATDNGLSGTAIYLTGSYDEVSAIATATEITPLSEYIATLVDDDGNKWLLWLDNSVFSEKKTYAQCAKNHICVVGYYDGYSTVYEMPIIIVTNIYDMHTGNLIASSQSITYSPDSSTYVERPDTYSYHFSFADTMITLSSNTATVEITNTTDNQLNVEYRLCLYNNKEVVETIDTRSVNNLESGKTAVQKIDLGGIEFDDIEMKMEIVD